MLQSPFSLFDKKPKLIARLSDIGRDDLVKLLGLYSVDCPSEVKQWRIQLDAPIAPRTFPSNEPQIQPKSIRDFSSLIALMNSLGIAAISLLIDRVNEFAPAAYVPYVGAPFVCVETLISHLRLWNAFM